MRGKEPELVEQAFGSGINLSINLSEVETDSLPAARPASGATLTSLANDGRVVAGSSWGGGMSAGVKVRRMLIGTAALVCALCFLMALASSRAFGEVVTCGQTLTHDTTLDNDLACPDVGLFVGADGITIDLNGHMIEGNSSYPDVGVEDRAGYDNITVENGTIRNFTSGVLLGGSDHSTVRDLTVSDTESIVAEGIFLSRSPYAVVERVTTDHAFEGIVIWDGSHHAHVDNISVSRSDYGISVSFNSGYALIEKSVVSRSGEAVEVRDIPGVTVIKNHLVQNGIGVQADNSPSLVLEKNDVTESFGDGIVVGQSPGALLSENRVDRNGRDGIHVYEAATTITKNTANDNGEYGIEAVPGVIDGGGNRASGNGNPLQCLYVQCK
jgi:parallel beta-helix repeat protein